MNEQFIVYPYYEILFGNKMEKNMIHVMTWINLKIIMLHERSQTKTTYNISSVQFSPSIMSDSLWPHGLQHTWLPCPSPTSRACSNACPLSWWCHPTISSSVVPSSCLQSFPASKSFPMSQLHQVAEVLKFQLQHPSFQWRFRTDFLQDWLLWSALFICSSRKCKLIYNEKN